MPVYTALYFTLQLTILSICSAMLPTLHLLELSQTTGAMATAQDNDVISWMNQFILLHVFSNH